MLPITGLRLLPGRKAIIFHSQPVVIRHPLSVLATVVAVSAAAVAVVSADLHTGKILYF